MNEHRDGPSAAEVWRTIRRRSFCTVATASAIGAPHVVGVLYAAVDHRLYLSTQVHSRKGRNLTDTGRAAICIPVRRYPVGPPFCIQFTATAEVLRPDEPGITALIANGALKSITSHGELEDPDSWFVRLVPNRRIHTYGLGVPIRQVLRDPISASRTVTWEAPVGA